MKRWLVLLLFCVGSAWGSARTTYGGTLRIATPVAIQKGVPWTQTDGILETGFSTLTREGLCRMTDKGIQWVLAASVSMTSSRVLKIELKPNLQKADGSPFSTQDVLSEWRLLFAPLSPSPYAALLEPFQIQGKFQIRKQTAQSLELEVVSSVESYLPSLCHPALSFSGVGPFVEQSGQFNLHHIHGRPFVDAVATLFVSLKEQDAAWRKKEVDVAWGIFSDGQRMEGPGLFATYLGFRADRVESPLRKALWDIDRDELRRLFVRAPSWAMTEWLPEPLMTQRAHIVKNASSLPQATSQGIQLLYDESLADQKSVALRIQVKLHDAGFRIIPQGVSRKQLRARWQSGDFDLIMHTVLLPPHAPSAMSLLFSLAKMKPGPFSTASTESLDLIPLYSQGLRISTHARGIQTDAQGLIRFDDAVVSED